MNEGEQQTRIKLLTEQDPAPVWIANRDGSSPFLILGDHAGRHVPQRLGDLGVSTSDLARHIACDIGVEALGRALSSTLDACCIGQRYSRLVIDCNRYPGTAESVVQRSDGSIVPGNLDLSAEDIAVREREIFVPYHTAISQEIEARRERGQQTCLILLHSFTPIWDDLPRPWQIGVLYHHDTRLAQSLLRLLHAESAAHPEMIVGDNQPYTAADGTDYALARYGERLQLLHVELEIRQDLIAEAAGQSLWAERLSRLLTQALSQITEA